MYDVSTSWTPTPDEQIKMYFVTFLLSCPVLVILFSRNCVQVALLDGF